MLALIMITSFTAVAGAEETERTGDVVILYTGDIHCGIDQGFGYAGVQAVREYLVSQGNDVILVDTGDNLQGEPVGTMSKGEIPMELMNDMKYDIAIPGNHDFDYGMDQFLSLVEKAHFPYISCNFNKQGDLVFPPYIIKEAGGTPVLAHPIQTRGIGRPGSEEFFTNIEAIIKRLKHQGLKGLECFHPDQNFEQSMRFVEMAEKYHLHITRGSDFHGKDFAEADKTTNERR